MPHRLRELCQFIIGFRALKALKVSLPLRFGRWAADGIRLRGLFDSHSTINDIMSPAACQAHRLSRMSLSSETVGTRPEITTSPSITRAVTPRDGFEFHVSEMLNCDFHKSFQHGGCNWPPKATCETILPLAVSPPDKTCVFLNRSAIQVPIYAYANQSGISTRRPPLGTGSTVAPGCGPHLASRE
jgi:hypothetical protein